MKQFEITSAITTSQYKYKNDEIIVNGNYQVNAQTNQFQRLEGTAYAQNENGEQGAYIGNFNGSMQNGTMVFNFSGISMENLPKVQEAIEDIEAEIFKVDE